MWGGSAALARIQLDNNVSHCTDPSPADSLKKNPVMGEDELEQVAPGLGSEAAQQGFGGISDKYGRL